LEAGEPLRLRLLVRLADEIELELGGQHRPHPECLDPLDLPAQDGAGGNRDEFAGGLVDDVAEDECRSLEPRQDAKRSPVRAIEVVAVAGFPVHQGVAVRGGHLHLGAEEVGAEVGAVIEAVVEEETAGHPLPDETALHVTGGGDHRLDLVPVDQHPELVDPERVRCSFRHRAPPICVPAAPFR
jgi:hypothetical protein